METIKEFYHLVKNFWIDLFKAFRKGTETHLKAIKIFLVSCIVVFVILLQGSSKIYRVLHLLWTLSPNECLYGVVEDFQP